MALESKLREAFASYINFVADRIAVQQGEATESAAVSTIGK
jgi:hypothetical protein